MSEIVYPEPYGIYVRKRTSVSLWTRVRMRTMVLFSVDRTPYEMALVFEALQDANLRIAALEEALKIETAQRRAMDATLKSTMGANGIT